MDIEITKLNLEDGTVVKDESSFDIIDQNFENIKNTLSNLSVPSRTSQILNDSDFVTSTELSDTTLAKIDEFNTNFKNIGSGLIWQEEVATYSAIATTYPNPDVSWTVKTKDTGYTYRYDGTEWELIDSNLHEGETVFLTSEKPSSDGIWFDLSDVESTVGKNSVAKEVISYVDEQMSEKVQKVDGKGLSTNDYDNTEKAEVAKVKNKADVVYVDTKLGSLGATAIFKGKDTNANILALTNMIVGDEWYDTTNNTYLRYNGISWVNVGTDTKYANDSVSTDMIQNNAIIPRRTNFFSKYATKNIYDYTDCVDGYYMNYTNASIAVNATYFYTKYIEVEPETTYVGSATSGDFGGMITFFDSAKKRIGGVQVTAGTSNVQFTTSVNCKYMVVSTTIQRKPYLQIEKGTVSTEYVPCVNGYKLNDGYTGEIILTYDGTVTFRKLLEIAKEIATELHPVRIKLREQEYNMYASLTDTEKADSTFIGITVPDFVTLEGIGRKENVILEMVLDTANQYMSTLNLANTAGLKNLTVKGIKTRYAIHDDFATTTDYSRKLENVIVYAENTYYGCAYGSGGKSGEDAEFKECVFINKQGSAFLWHSNSSFTKPARLKFDNCKFYARSDKESIVLRSVLGCGVKNQIILNNCECNGISMKEDTTGSGSGLDFEITGSGNTKNMLYSITVSNGEEYCTEFADEITVLYAPTTYSKGIPIYKNAEYGIQLTSGISVYKFAGVLMKSVVAGDFEIIKSRGMVRIEDMNLTAVQVGDKIGITNGVFAFTTGTDYIGICTVDGYIKLNT